MNSKKYLKWSCIVVPSLVAMLVGGIYFSYKSFNKANPTGVIEPGSMSMGLVEYTAFFSVLCLIVLIGWLIIGFILMLRKLYRTIVKESI